MNLPQSILTEHNLSLPFLSDTFSLPPTSFFSSQSYRAVILIAVLLSVFITPSMISNDFSWTADSSILICTLYRVQHERNEIAHYARMTDPRRLFDVDDTRLATLHADCT